MLLWPVTPLDIPGSDGVLATVVDIPVLRSRCHHGMGMHGGWLLPALFSCITCKGGMIESHDTKCIDLKNHQVVAAAVDLLEAAVLLVSHCVVIHTAICAYLSPGIRS